MTRFPPALVMLLASAVPVCAQQAQLARKGRQREQGPPSPREPIRKLPFMAPGRLDRLSSGSKI